MGGFRDRRHAKKIANEFAAQGYRVEADILSCHRHAEFVEAYVEEFKGKVLWAVGGIPFAQPGVVASWALKHRKHVLVIASPIEETEEELVLARSSFTNLPSPTHVHALHDNSPESIKEKVELAIGFARGTKIPPCETQRMWEERVQLYHNNTPSINVRLD